MGKDKRRRRREEVMKLMVRDGGQILYGTNGEMDADRGRARREHGMVWKQAD